MKKGRLTERLTATTMVTLFFVLTCSGRSHGDVTLLVEEPFGSFGAITPTGHAALYLSRVCAVTPTHLRRCLPGESGVVLSRYARLNGYDWVAIPLVPYLYAVDDLNDVPLSADPVTVAQLRDDYRRRNLEQVAPDGPHDETPSGTWTELVGSAYDRKIYGFEIETTEAQDDRLINELNSHRNHSHFNILFHNCADFSGHLLNEYYPHAVHRSYIADAGISTPKQLARSLVRYGKHHEITVSAFFIPQVPGSQPQSHKMRGVCEAFVKSKKYIVPFAVLHPLAATGMVAAYLTTGHFDVNHYAETRIGPTDLPMLWDTSFSASAQ
jgi:hypothetical protein